MKAGKILTLDDLRARAKRQLPKAVFDFVDGGASRERTLRDNSEAFARWRIMPSLAVDTAGQSTAVQLLGRQSQLPLIIAPTGLAGMICPKGEIILARQAEAAGIPFCLSTMSVASIEEIKEAAPAGRLWFQIYPLRDSNLMDAFIDRAADAGYEALCLSVDQPTHGRRLRDARNGFTVPLRFTPKSFWDFASHPAWSLNALLNPVRFGNFPEKLGGVASAAQHINSLLDPSFTWNSIERLRKRWSGKLIIKGLLSAADAKLAQAAGADAIVVSNHGGRQLDDVPATLDALVAVAEAVGSKTEIIIDGGIRSGSDVIKALALGASACMIGRPSLFALAAEKDKGVQAMINIVRDELNNALTLMGARTLEDINREHVVPSGQPLHCKNVI